MDHILGRKIGMTQVFLENGSVVPVTVIQAGPCFVTAVRTPAKDGYEAVQVAFEQTNKRITKPKAGYLKKRNLSNLRFLREFRSSAEGAEVGQAITVEIFAKGDFVDVCGTTKGKGFQGGVKRHGFAGGPKTHGQSDRLRAPGSIGSGTTPGRVFKGTRMAGHMGHVRHTTLNLQVVGVDTENNVLLVKGAVPGADQGLVTVRKAIKKRLAK
ncbi:MAG: rplC [Chloroflexi bacterium]|jgi:large subunit ribosomal protein L3|nr:rplC [Chloroflexota bacterium]MDB5076709.1 rplC [Chloroflexota bacterium]